jgi:uncharacterized protein
VKRDLTALAFAMLFPSVMTWVYFVAVADGGEGGNRAVTLAYGMGKFIQFAFPAVFVFFVDRKALRPSWPTWRGAMLGLGFGLAVAGAAMALYHFGLKGTELLHAAPEKIHEKLRQFGADSLAGFVVVAVFISVFHSLFEEYYWRWFVFGRWLRYTRSWAATILASLAFMSHHVIVLAVYFPGVGRFFAMVLPLSLGVAVGGGVWCWLYRRSGSLYAAWISHALIDGAIMMIGFDLLGDGFEPR